MIIRKRASWNCCVNKSKWWWMRSRTSNQPEVWKPTTTEQSNYWTAQRKAINKADLFEPASSWSQTDPKPLGCCCPTSLDITNCVDSASLTFQFPWEGSTLLVNAISNHVVVCLADHFTHLDVVHSSVTRSCVPRWYCLLLLFPWARNLTHIAPINLAVLIRKCGQCNSCVSLRKKPYSHCSNQLSCIN